MFNMSDFSNVSSPDSLGSEKGMGAQDDKHSEPNGRTQASEPAQLTQPPQVNEPALTRYPPNQNPTTPTRRPAAQESPQFMRRDPAQPPCSSKITKSIADLSTPERTHLRANAEQPERYDAGTAPQRNPIRDAQWTNDVFEADSPGRPLPLNEVIEEADFWSCTQCGMKNLPTNGECSNCEEEL